MRWPISGSPGETWKDTGRLKESQTQNKDNRKDGASERETESG